MDDLDDFSGAPLSELEIKKVRQEIRDRERATWLVRLFTRWALYLSTALGMAWASYEWLLKHVAWKGLP